MLSFISVMFSEKFVHIQKGCTGFKCSKSWIKANCTKHFCYLVVVFPPCFCTSIFKQHHFCMTNFHAITQSRANRRLFSDSKRPWIHVCISSRSCICSDSLRGRNTDVSPAVCGSNPGLLVRLLVSAASSVCLEQTAAFYSLLRTQQLCAAPLTCMQVLTLQSKKSPKAKRAVVCLHLSLCICEYQADRGVCCCSNRPIVLCLRYKSYLHYTFYKQTTSRDTFLEMMKEVGVFFLPLNMTLFCVCMSFKSNVSSIFNAFHKIAVLFLCKPFTHT